MPEVSVVIPAYNYADYTVQAVESVLAQTFKDFELIVIDDGSTDGTGDALKRFGDRIKYIYKENGGVSSARNLGIRMAKGKYIAFLDCDDLWLPDKLEESLQGFEDDAVGLVYTDAYQIDIKGNIISSQRSPGHSGWVFEDLLVSNFINNPSVVIKKICFDSVGVFDENLFYAADWDMWLRISEKFKIKYYGKKLSKYRIVRDYCFMNPEKAKAETLLALKKAYARNPNIPKRIVRKSLSELYASLLLVYYLKKETKKVFVSAWQLLLYDPGKTAALSYRYIRKNILLALSAGSKLFCACNNLIKRLMNKM